MPAAAQSVQPFPATLEKLMEERELSGRELTEICRTRGWGSIRATQDFRNGEARPTERAMQNFATALQVRPEVFAEYRLLKMRQLLDPDVVGFKKAIKNLERFEVIQRAEGAEEKPPKAPRRHPGARRGRSASS